MNFIESGRHGTLHSSRNQAQKAAMSLGGEWRFRPENRQFCSLGHLEERSWFVQRASDAKGKGVSSFIQRNLSRVCAIASWRDGAATKGWRADHEYADANCHRVHLDDPFDCGFASCIVGHAQRCRQATALVRKPWPTGEVGHAATRQRTQAQDCCVKQGAQDAGLAISNSLQSSGRSAADAHQLALTSEKCRGRLNPLG
jgi:hypothetical protein